MELPYYEYVRQTAKNHRQWPDARGGVPGGGVAFRHDVRHLYRGDRALLPADRHHMDRGIRPLFERMGRVHRFRACGKKR